MNAVKRCQALIAATLLIGVVACGGDPTAGGAGKDLSIRATPGAVWVRNNSSASVSIEAVDGLGGPVEGSWSVGTVTGPFTAVLDTTFQNTTAGALSVKARFVITPTAEGDGSVDFTGTGGTVNVPIRIAPDSSAFNIVFSTPTQTGDSVIIPLNAPVTVAAPAGVRFTAGTVVTIAVGPLARDTALFHPINFTIAADSTHLTFTPGPNAFRPGASQNHVRITGVAEISTPGLTSTARSTQRVVVDQFDTAGSTRLLLSTVTPLIGDNITVTLPPEYRFSPNTTVNHFRDTTISGNILQVANNGLAAPGVVSVSADSGTLVYLPAPGARGQPRFTGIRVRNNAAAWSITARSAQSYSVPNILNIAAVQPATAVENALVTITMPAGTKLRPTSTVRTNGGPAIDAIVVSRAADSSSMTVIPVPGFFKPFTLTALKDTRVPALSLTLPSLDSTKTSSAVTAPNHVPSLGQDDPAAGVIPTVNGPAALNDVVGFFDSVSVTASDLDFDCGCNFAQFIRIHAVRTGNVQISTDWTGGTASNTDADVVLMKDDGLFGPLLRDAITNSKFTAAGSNKPEAATWAMTAGSDYFLMIVDFGASGLDGAPFTGIPAGNAWRVTMTGK